MNIFAAILFCVGLLQSEALRCWECNDASSNQECLDKGQVVNCHSNEQVCEDQTRHVSGGTGMVINKRCKQEQACQANVNQNLRPAVPVQCHINSPNSICTCCCSRDECNRDLQTCWNIYATQAPPAQRRDCPGFPKPPANAMMQCQGNGEPGTACAFQCQDNFNMRGSHKTTCMPNGKWDYTEPICTEKSCNPRMIAPRNGAVRCTKGKYLRSRCTFSCNRNYELLGARYSDCRIVGSNSKYGRWSRSQPRCRPLFCPIQTPTYHVIMDCSRGDRRDSVCKFTCPETFEIFPHDIPGRDFSQTRCMRSGEWSNPFPCCHLPCPPFATIDFFLVMDSSSSVEDQNWEQMKTFVRTMLSNFTVRSDAAQYSVFRYNGEIDTETQIFLNSSRNKEEFIEMFNRIPYNGNGTNTGKALDHVRTVMKKVGNREEAADIVLLITDGKSQDRVAIPARRLRDSGVLLLVLPIQKRNGDRIDLKQIRQIAGSGNETNILTDALEGGFDALNDAFARRLSSYLCPIPCANPFHSHPGEIPHRLEGFIDTHPLHK